MQCLFTAEVNKEWLKKHPETLVLSSPRSELPRPVNASPHIVPESSFDLPLQNGIYSNLIFYLKNETSVCLRLPAD